MQRIPIEKLHQFRSHVSKEALTTTDGSDLLDKLVVDSEATLQFIGRGTFGNVFFLNRPFPMAVKFVPGIDNSKYNASRQAFVAKALESLVVDGITPHISTVITAFWIDTQVLPLEVITFPKKLDRKPHSKTLAIFTEWADSGDLLKLIQRNPISLSDLKILVFQVVFTLVKIQERFPNFKHNDLKPNNILIHSEEREFTTRTYELSPLDKFVLPIMMWHIKINDFDLSTIKSKKKNHYADVHFFFATMVAFTKRTNNLPEEFIIFVDSILDKEGPFKATNRCKYIGEREPTTAKFILQHSFFEEFKVKTSRPIGHLNNS